MTEEKPEERATTDPAQAATQPPPETSQNDKRRALTRKARRLVSAIGKAVGWAGAVFTAAKRIHDEWFGG